MLLVVKDLNKKNFDQTKGISMAGSPTYTANASLDSTFGDNTTLSGTVSTVDPDVNHKVVLLWMDQTPMALTLTTINNFRRCN